MGFVGSTCTGQQVQDELGVAHYRVVAAVVDGKWEVVLLRDFGMGSPLELG